MELIKVDLPTPEFPEKALIFPFSSSLNSSIPSPVFALVKITPIPYSENIFAVYALFLHHQDRFYLIQSLALYLNTLQS